MTASRPRSEPKPLTQREWRISPLRQRRGHPAQWRARIKFTKALDPACSRKFSKCWAACWLSPLHLALELTLAPELHVTARAGSFFPEIFLSVGWHGCLGSPWILEREGGNKSLGRWGRISVDRSSKATLPLTIPRPIFKSSAKDSSPRSSEIECKAPTPGCSAGAGELSTHASGGACAPLLVVG